MRDLPKPMRSAVNAGDLRRVALFHDLDDEALAGLARHFVELRVPADQFLFREGEVSEDFYVIGDGALAVFRDWVGSPSQLLGRLRKNDFCGEIGLFTTFRHSASVRASEPSCLLKIAKDDFLAFLDDHPAIRAELEAVALRRHSANLAAALELAKQREIRVRLHREVILHLEDGTAHPATLENLSVGGFCLYGAPASWQAEETVRFGLGLPIGTLQLAGRIAWRRDDAVGMAFSEMIANHDTIIQLVIHLLLESSP
jgi:CRP-like cAMP-binding protein